MKYENMFKPIQIGTVTIPNRFAVPPMGNNFANTDGTLSERSKSYYGARAKGGFGLITIESTVVYEQAKGGPRKPCLFTDDTVASFKEVVDACHSYGSKVSIQLQHAGPEGSSKLTGYPLKAASPIPTKLGREVPEEIPVDEIYRLIECYGDAARRAQLAGIDMVELHCAHGYLVSTFVSSRTNKRLDEFGGCFENRMRLPRLIIENIREKTGGKLPIICRVNGTDDIPGGQTLQDACAVSDYLVNECGVDAIHVSRAIHLHDECMWAPGISHGGFNEEFFKEVKETVDVPVIAVGRFTEPNVAEIMVKRGLADIIAFGRQSIADPELPNKARNGKMDKVSPCIGCLLGCVPNMLTGKPITCLMNPAVGRENDLQPAEVKKKVVVIGAGPAGMYAAATAAERGHDVTIIEKQTEVGGNFRIASYPPGKDTITWAIRSEYVKCVDAGVKFMMGTEATAEVLAELKPEAIVLATGSTPLILRIPGLDTCGYVTAQDFLIGKGGSLGKKVLVVGGGMVGCEAAEFLAERNHEVSIVEMKYTIAGDVGPEIRKYMFDSFKEHEVKLVGGARVTEFFTDGVSYSLEDGTAGELRGFDNIVLAMGSRSYNPLEEEAKKVCDQVIVIGEALKAPGNACIANGQGFEAGLAI